VRPLLNVPLCVRERSAINFPRLALAAVIAWVAFMAIGWGVHEVLLTDFYARQAVGIRGEGASSSAIGFAAALIGFFAFAYTYAKGYEGGQGAQEGMRFGVLVALMLITLTGVWGHVVFPMSGGFTAVLAIDYVVEFAVYGMIVDAIYRPPAPRRSHAT
jgi:hypothetical protein